MVPLVDDYPRDFTIVDPGNTLSFATKWRFAGNWLVFITCKLQNRLQTAGSIRTDTQVCSRVHKSEESDARLLTEGDSGSLDILNFFEVNYAELEAENHRSLANKWVVIA